MNLALTVVAFFALLAGVACGAPPPPPDLFPCQAIEEEAVACASACGGFAIESNATTCAETVPLGRGWSRKQATEAQVKADQVCLDACLSGGAP